MATTFRLDPEGNAALLAQLATGFAEFGEEAARTIAQTAPSKTGRYRRTFHATTFLDNRIVSGPAIRGKGIKSNAQLWTAIYTTSPLGHLLELGTAAHDIPVTVAHGPFAERIIHHPGSRRYPHFWIGFTSVLARAGSIIAGAAKVRGRVDVRII